MIPFVVELSDEALDLSDVSLELSTVVFSVVVESPSDDVVVSADTPETSVAAVFTVAVEFASTSGSFVQRSDFNV